MMRFAVTERDAANVLRSFLQIADAASQIVNTATFYSVESKLTQN
jgi:hypothetical protein